MKSLTALCLALCCFPVYAQQSTARLLGTVTDPTGASVSDALVSVTNVATKLVRETRTDTTGDYSLTQLPIGEYSMQVEAAGFRKEALVGITLQVAQEARVDVKLSLGSTNESVTVEVKAPILNTESSTVGQVIENATIENMPLNGRAFWQLAQLTPGVVFTPGGSDISSGGQGIRATRVGLRVSGNSRLAGGWFLDGFDITEYELGATSITPSTDAIEEFKVLAGGMSAEYALPSVINAALKSGTNSYHGSLYEYLRNEKLQARNFFQSTVAPLKRNQFGTTFGGPIKKDTVFFFADYEGSRTRQGTSVNSTVPTVAQLNGDFSGQRPIYDPLSTIPNPASPNTYLRTQFPGNIIPANRLSPQALYFKNLFPAPNSGANRYAYSPALSLDTDKFDIKVSPRLTEKDSLVSRYSYADNTETDPAAYPGLNRTTEEARHFN